MSDCATRATSSSVVGLAVPKYTAIGIASSNVSRAVDVERAEGHGCVEHHPNDLLGTARSAVAERFGRRIDEDDRGFEPARLRDERGVPEVGERVLEIGVGARRASGGEIGAAAANSAVLAGSGRG